MPSKMLKKMVSAYFQMEIDKLKKIVQKTWNTNLASWNGLMAPLSHHEWKVTSRWRDGFRSHHLYTHWLTPQIVRFKYLHMMRVFLGLEKCNYDRCICLFSSFLPTKMIEALLYYCAGYAVCALIEKCSGLCIQYYWVCINVGELCCFLVFLWHGLV